MYCGKDENKQKEAEIGPFKKKLKVHQNDGNDSSHQSTIMFIVALCDGADLIKTVTINNL